MDLSFSPEHAAFRAEARAFIASALPPQLRAKAEIDAHFEHHEIMEWHRILYRKGWVAPHWPIEHGGPGLDATRRFILSEELELANTPMLSPFGLVMVGPAIIEFGSAAQQRRFLPSILAGDEVWCQGYSEPGAGSDLASLTTRAEDDGAGFVVNGQKTWTTYAQHADWIFCLVRTDPRAKKQSGISFLLIDLKTPGVTVKPFLTIGGTPAFCETFFDNVRVPYDNLVGPLHGGWTVAKALLGHERTLIAAVGQIARGLRLCKRIAGHTRSGDRTLLDDPAVRARIARLEVRHRSLQLANYRALAGAQLGKAPGPESSILKICGAELVQRAYELAMELMGHDALAWFPDPGVVPALEHGVASTFCYYRATTIYGGSNEIQKNIIAKQILGLGGARVVNFEHSDDQRMLVDAVAAFTRRQSPVSRMRKLRDDPVGWSPAVWRQMGELGWIGLALPEAAGGMAGRFVDVALVLEQLGTTLVPEPLVASLVAAAAIAAAGDHRQQQAWLAPLVAGRSSLALAWAEADGRYDPAHVATRADPAGAGYRLTGHKRFVLDGHAATQLVVSARSGPDAGSGGGVSLFVVDAGAPGVGVRSVRTIDGRRAALVELDGVEVAPDRRLGPDGAGLAALAYALDVGAAAACAEGVGIMRAVLAMTVEYLRTREQFGVKIGSFQVLQHRAVDMFVETELAYSAALAAAIRIDDPDPRERATAVSCAKVQLAESGRFVTQQAIQLHGGIGITDEHDVGLYFKRMLALNASFGDAEHHLARLSALPSFTAEL